MNEIFLISEISLLIIISVISSKASDKFGVPALILFLIIGMIAGSQGIGLIRFDNVQLAKIIGVIALSIILFYGGLDTQWKTVSPVLKQGITLATLGVFFTAVILGMLCVFFLKFSLAEGMLVGAIVSSTDAAAVFSVLRSKNISLKEKLKSLLELESGANDPMAVFLTIAIINFLQSKTQNIFMFVSKFFIEMAIGLVAGFIIAKLMIFIINKIKLFNEGLYPVLMLAFILFDYSVTSAIGGNGFLAVYIAGLISGNSMFLHKKSIIRFHCGLAWLMQITMFLTLGLLVFPSQLVPVIYSGLLISVLLMFVARPVSVFLCLIPFKMDINEKLMISWVGLRGAAPIILGIFPLMAGVEKAEEIFNLVFFIVLTSALVQGTTIPPISKFLKVYEPFKDKKIFPIEFEDMPGIDAEMHELFIPYESIVSGKTIFELGVPKQALVALVSRNEKFIIPNGSTVIGGGDVLLVLTDKEGIKELESKVNVLKPKEEIVKDEKKQQEDERLV